MKNIIRLFIIYSIITVFTTGLVMAKTKLTMGVGTIFISGQSNLIVDDNDENAYLDSLDSKGSHFSGFAIVPQIGISSDALKENGIDIKLGISEADEFAPALRIGFKFSEKQKIEVSTFYNPLSKVWKDPFLVGSDRDSTTFNLYGFRISYNNILNTNFSFQHRLMIYDIDQDKSGEQYSELKRDGVKYETQGGYTFHLPNKMMFKPKLIFNHAEMNGNANSYNGFGGSLELIIPKKAYVMLISGGYTHQDYQEKHPIFDKTRKGNSTNVKAAIKLKNVFDIKGAGISFFIGYTCNDSNIHFYDSNITVSGVIVDYTF